MSQYADLDRPPLSERALARALLRPDGLWRDLRVVPVTQSTNADVAAAARDGAAEGLVLVAESQTSGRGRLGRVWSAPPRSGLTFSVLLRPTPVPATSWGWLTLLTGVAIASAVRQVAEVDATLKWPNDVLVDGRKLAGVLAERIDTAVVLGVGINVSLRDDELPVPTATSLALAGALTVDRDTVLRAVLRELETRYTSWCTDEAAGERLAADYRAACSTLGRQVRVELPGGAHLVGEACGIDADGRLEVRTSDGVVPVGAGDVVHLHGATG